MPNVYKTHSVIRVADFSEGTCAQIVSTGATAHTLPAATKVLKEAAVRLCEAFKLGEGGDTTRGGL